MPVWPSMRNFTQRTADQELLTCEEHVQGLIPGHVKGLHRLEREQGAPTCSKHAEEELISTVSLALLPTYCSAN